MSGELILVTGVSGFLGAHVAEQLLERGYRVRGTVRGSRYQICVDTVKRPGLEFVDIDDIATADFTEALKGVSGVLHMAASLPGRTQYKEMFNAQIEGTLNVVRQAHAAGIKKIVATSSFGCLLSPTFTPAFHGLTFNEENWGPVPEDELEEKKDEKFYVYFASKIKAEEAFWEYARAHPDLQCATIIPGYVVGPYSDLFPLPVNEKSMSTNDFVLQILNGGDTPPAPNWIVDPRDIALGHIRAYEGLPFTGLDNKRFIINSGTFTWAQAIAHVKKNRPDIADRLVDPETIPALPGVLSHLDNTKSRDILKINYRPVEEAIDAAFDAVVKAEAYWKAQAAKA